MKRRDVNHFCPELKSTTVIGSLRQQQLLKTMTETHCRRLVMTSVVSRQWTLPPMKGKAVAKSPIRQRPRKQTTCVPYVRFPIRAWRRAFAEERQRLQQRPFATLVSEIARRARSEEHTSD